MLDLFKEWENKKELNTFYALKHIPTNPHSHHNTASPFSAGLSHLSGLSGSLTEDATNDSAIPNSNDNPMLQKWLEDLENEDPNDVEEAELGELPLGSDSATGVWPTDSLDHSLSVEYVIIIYTLIPWHWLLSLDP